MSSSSSDDERLRRRLLGVWSLLRWECRVAGDLRASPLGASPAGQLIYTPSGYMSGVLMRVARPMFAVGGIIGAAPDAKLAAIDGYISYAGRYRVSGGEIFHDVQLSLLPDWVGTMLTRRVSWSGEDLVLSPLEETTKTGKIVEYHLTWCRESDLG